MAVHGINKVILVGRLGKDPKSVTSQTGAQWQTCRWPRQKAGATNRRGDTGADRMASRGAVRQARGSGW